MTIRRVIKTSYFYIEFAKGLPLEYGGDYANIRLVIETIGLHRPGNWNIQM